jgi:hypothetical protein
MTLEQRDRLLELSHLMAALIVELEHDRAASTDKARIRGVLRHLEDAYIHVDKAVRRAEQV